MGVQHDVAAGNLVVQALDQDLLGAELVAAMDQVHLLGDVCQIECLFHSGVAAADHGHFLVAIEEAVTGGAGGDAAALEGLFGRQAQVLGGGAGRDDQRITGVFAVVALEAERTLGQLYTIDVIEQDAGIELLRMLFHALHQGRTGQTLGVTGPVLHFGGGSQLTALLHAGDEQRIEVGTGGVDSRGVTSRAGAQDQQFAMSDLAHDVISET